MTSVSLPGVAGLATLFTAAAITTAPAQEVTLRAASFVPVNSSFGWPFQRWVDAVNEQCAGKLSIEVLDTGAISPFELPNAVRAGVVDMASVPPSYYKGITVEADTAVLSNVPIAEQRENGAWALLNQIHEEKMNVHYLTAFGDGVRFHIYTTKPMQDGRLDGFTMRTSPIYDSFFRSLGADVVQIPPPEVYTALERGVADGYGWPIWGIFDNGWDEYTKYVYEPGFYNVMVNQLINLDRWKSLSDDQQACLNEMSKWLEAEWPAWRDDWTAKELVKIETAGLEVVDYGPEFREAADTIYWETLLGESPELVAQLRPLLLRE